MIWCPLNTNQECPRWSGPCVTNMGRDCLEVRETMVSVIPWKKVQKIDEWLDGNVSPLYLRQPLGQDWARIAKVIEELGEAIQELILMTGQNPRKEQDSTAYYRLIEELADTAITAILAMQHFTKDYLATSNMLTKKVNKIYTRISNEKENGG